MRRIFILTALFVAVIGPAMGQRKTAEEQIVRDKAIAYARSIAFAQTDTSLLECLFHSPSYFYYTGDFDKVRPITEHRELFYKGWTPLHFSNKVLGMSDAFGESRAFAIVSGEHVLMVPQNGSTATELYKGGTVEIVMDSLVFHFKKGKFYTIDGEIIKDDIVNFSIKETDTAAYLSYRKAHPDLFEGVWQGEKKSLSEKIVIRHTFSGDRVKIESNTSGIPKRSYEAEGRFIYNENTLIFFPEKVRFNNKTVNKVYDLLPWIWYYTKNGDTLQIDNNKKWLETRRIVWKNGITFHRVTTDTENQ